MAVESIRGNLSTTGRLRANLAVGGGSDVVITPTYNDGIKIADYSIDGSDGEIYIPDYPEPVTNEIIQLTPGNDTATRTFVFDKKPIHVTFNYTNVADGWKAISNVNQGDSYLYGFAAPATPTTGVTLMFENVTWSADGKTLTITGHNSFGAVNTSSVSGFINVIY